MSYGSLEQAMKLLEVSNGSTVLNTSYIERLNGTLRERLASLTRKCRHASEKLFAFHAGMYLIRNLDTDGEPFSAASLRETQRADGSRPGGRTIKPFFTTAIHAQRDESPP